VNSETVSFLYALKLDKESVTPTSLPSVLETIFSETCVPKIVYICWILFLVWLRGIVLKFD
jgi:hypothetical protein